MRSPNPRRAPALRARSSIDTAPAVLVETARVVWPTAQRLELTRVPRPRGEARDYLVLPRLTSPRWLLPADAGAAAAVILRQNGRGVARRTAGLLLALAHRAGVARILPMKHLRVVGGHDESLVAALHSMGDPDVTVALRLGSWGHARSLVVRLIRPDGSTYAFGKVGIDAHGRASVEAEALNLSRVAELGLTRTMVSDVLRETSWNGLEVLLVSPLLVEGSTWSSPGPPVDAMLELAAADGARVAPLADSAWRSRAGERLTTIVDPRARDTFESCLSRLDVCDATVPLGPWHGDWTTWNMAWADGRVLLWDWEHFGEDVPVGFDLVHYLAQELRVSAGTSRTTEDEWRARAAAALSRHVDLTEQQQDAVLVAYLLEVNLRFVLDRQHTPWAAVRRDGWGLELLRREAERLAPS